MNKLQAGSIYDRNGLVLATSNPGVIKRNNRGMDIDIPQYNIDSATHQRFDRFYPFQNQTFFWTGDMNTGIFNGGINGYFAEYEHAAELRGFKTPTTSYTVVASQFRENQFLPRQAVEMTVVKRDFKSLSALLLAGVNSSQVEAFKHKNRDITLSIDAGLQTAIQTSVSTDDSLKNNRVSVVIMEANTGDVLTSAVYPLPNIYNMTELNAVPYEGNNISGWTTSSDLGFTYATQPGSAAKILTALAAFNKLGLNASNIHYTVSSRERIRTKGVEPDETGDIGMEQAVVKSNNVYFIKLANQQHLEKNMVDLYIKTGMFLHGIGGYYYSRPVTNQVKEENWMALWTRAEFNLKPTYNPDNIRINRAKGISGMAWGQGDLIATPASVARLVSGIANQGRLVDNRYVLKINDSSIVVKPAIALASNPEYVNFIANYMLKQSAPKASILGIKVAGKTGTPERIWRNEKINDGWYVFFAPMPARSGNIVVCIRVEGTKGSANAVRLAGKHVIPALFKRGYIKSF
ncbi:MAG: hypothetical protein NVS3B13_39080 [Mucilaginibacter sp.]